MQSIFIMGGIFMQYVIGIVGGGTKTLLKIADMKGNLLTECKGGPSNINAIGRAHTAEIIQGLILKGISNINETLKNCRAICIGAAGISSSDEKKIIEEIIRNIGYCGKTIVTNDSVTELYGGVGGGEGIILVSGTGSICYGRNSSGMVCRAGGWGHTIGDEGSAYYIGVRGLNAVTRSCDGRADATLLTDMILNNLGLKSPEGLIEYVYRSGAGKKEIASIAKIVDEAYKKGDKAAESILKDAAYELFLCCKVVVEKLGLQNKNAAVVLSGSVITKNKYIYDKFSELINKTYPCLKLCSAKYDGAWGAVLIALDAAGDMK